MTLALDHPALTLRFTPMDVPMTRPWEERSPTLAANPPAVVNPLVLYPGAPTEAAILVANESDRPLDLSVVVGGDFPTEWCQVLRSHPTLAPGEGSTAILLFQVPADYFERAAAPAEPDGLPLEYHGHLRCLSNQAGGTAQLVRAIEFTLYLRPRSLYLDFLPDLYREVDFVGRLLKVFEMAFEPDGAGFKFNGKAAPSTLQFLAEDMETLDGDYAVDISAKPVEIILDELSGVDLGDDPLIACQASFDLIMNANAVVFETGSAVISRESGQTLDKIMAVSATCANNLKFEVGGHTDSIGDAVANISLSRARAQAVSDYMQAAGFDADRLLVIGYGPERPKADNSTPEGRAQNRRIEFSVQEWSE